MILRDSSLFFFNDTATTEIYTLSLHDALPISEPLATAARLARRAAVGRDRRRRQSLLVAGRPLHRLYRRGEAQEARQDRKSTRLNSSHANISYAVFCLKKKNTTPIYTTSIPTR